MDFRYMRSSNYGACVLLIKRLLRQNLVPVFEIVSIANTINHTKPFPKQTISNKQILSIDAE